jgi:hypothetical protein
MDGAASPVQPRIFSVRPELVEACPEVWKGVDGKSNSLKRVKPFMVRQAHHERLDSKQVRNIN